MDESRPATTYREGFSVGCDGVGIDVLQFAGDTLFIEDPSMKNMETIKCIICCFELCFGLKVNFYFYESMLGGVGVQSRHLNLAAILNCDTMQMPWAPVIENIK